MSTNYVTINTWDNTKYYNTIGYDKLCACTRQGTNGNMFAETIYDTILRAFLPLCLQISRLKKCAVFFLPLKCLSLPTVSIVGNIAPWWVHRIQDPSVYSRNPSPSSRWRGCVWGAESFIRSCCGLLRDVTHDAASSHPYRALGHLGHKGPASHFGIKFFLHFFHLLHSFCLSVFV